MKGPEPTGCSAKALAFSSSVAPGVASKSFWGMIAVLKVARPAARVGSGASDAAPPCPGS
jgi:hypothetical protein